MPLGFCLFRNSYLYTGRCEGLMDYQLHTQRLSKVETSGFWALSGKTKTGSVNEMREAC